MEISSALHDSILKYTYIQFKVCSTIQTLLHSNIQPMQNTCRHEDGTPICCWVKAFKQTGHDSP